MECEFTGTLKDEGPTLVSVNILVKSALKLLCNKIEIFLDFQDWILFLLCYGFSPQVVICRYTFLHSFSNSTDPFGSAWVARNNKNRGGRGAARDDGSSEEKESDAFHVHVRILRKHVEI